MEYVHNDHIVTSLNTQTNTQTSAQPCTNSQRHMTTLDDIGIQLTNDNLNQDEQRQLTELLIRNADIFATDLSQLPGCTLSKHTIHTGDAPPQRQRSYKHSPAARKEIE